MDKKEIKRYDHAYDGEYGRMERTKDGDYVEYEDVGGILDAIAAFKPFDEDFCLQFDSEADLGESWRCDYCDVSASHPADVNHRKICSVTALRKELGGA